MNTGTVKWYNDKKGYGFIIPDNANIDVFFHVSQLKLIGCSSIDNGRRVAFDTYRDRNRIAAHILQIL